MKSSASARAVRGLPPRPQPTAIDRLVGVFSPGAMLNRLRDRWRVTALTGGYRGGSKKRRPTQEWKLTADSADGALLPDLDTLRQRSRDLVRNVPLARGAINTKVTNVVGSGLTCRPQIDAAYLGLTPEQAEKWEYAAESFWRLWAESQECDITRTQTFAGLQDLVFRGALESGDIFVLKRFFERAPSPFGYTLQVIEADRITNPRWRRDTISLAGGVEMDANGAPRAYHIANSHPGDRARGAKDVKWLRVKAFGRDGRRRVLHIYRRLRIGQSRGEPDLAPVIESLHQLGDYTDAELQAAVISSFFTVFVKSDTGDSMDSMAPTDETGAKAGDEDIKLAPGMVVDLAKGNDIVTANPGRPNADFDPFVQAVLRQIGAALELPFEVLIKHFTASYSAARAAMLDAWRFFRVRRAWLAESLCQPVYEDVIAEVVARGWLEAPGFFTDALAFKAYVAAKWVGPGPGQLDPLREAKADEIVEDRAWETAAEITARRTGGDWLRNSKQRKLEKKAAGGEEDIKFPDAKTVNEKRRVNSDPPIEGGDAIYMPSSNIPAIEIEQG